MNNSCTVQTLTNTPQYGTHHLPVVRICPKISNYIKMVFSAAYAQTVWAVVAATILVMGAQRIILKPESNIHVFSTTQSQDEINTFCNGVVTRSAHLLYGNFTDDDPFTHTLMLPVHSVSNISRALPTTDAANATNAVSAADAIDAVLDWATQMFETKSIAINSSKVLDEVYALDKLRPGVTFIVVYQDVEDNLHCTVVNPITREQEGTQSTPTGAASNATNATQQLLAMLPLPLVIFFRDIVVPGLVIILVMSLRVCCLRQCHRTAVA